MARRLAAALALALLVGGPFAVARVTLASSAAVAPAEAEAAPPPPAARSAPAAPSSVLPGLAPDRMRPAPAPRPEPTPEERRLAELRRLERGIAWRRSRAVGRPDAGLLVDGVVLPREGVHFFTWDPVRWASTSPADRRSGTDRLVRVLLDVLADYAAANPDAPRVAIGDLSRPGGGSFDARHGALAEFGRGPGTLGHVSHQNGLDADVYYPRRDRREGAPDSLGDVDLRLAQELVDRFVAAGAQFVFVGPRTGLTGPRHVVQALVRHDDHLHVRLRPAG